MIMSLHDPIMRKRGLPTTNHNETTGGVVNKKLRSNDNKMITIKGEFNNTSTNDDDGFSEKMFTAYVKSALMSLEKVCFIFCAF